MRAEESINLYSYATAYLIFWITISFVASSHAALYKRDSRSLAGWIGVIWIAPILGAAFYLMFGINRIQRRAQKRRRVGEGSATHSGETALTPVVESDLGDGASHLVSLANLVGRVVNRPLLSGNEVQCLLDGDEAYPEMLRAIETAQHTVTMSSYIFDRDAIGQQFLETLQAAMKRGVRVRLLVDDVGVRHSWPTIIRRARRMGIPVARFLPALIPWLLYYANLRNHRKLLVIDGQVGFTGGINIREGHCLHRPTRHPERDIHFRIAGPVVTQLQHTFAQDWYCTTGEELSGEAWFPEIPDTGMIPSRGISDGPDDDLDKLRMVLLGAITSARSSIAIMTPYFLPDAAIISALNVASLRGVEVRIVLPEKPDVPPVGWAAQALLSQVLEYDCRVWMSKAPFDHSKLMIVDGQWTLLGSMNWDPRSLRLNFEFNLECYNEELARSLLNIVDERIADSRRFTLADVEKRSFAIKLRDGFARVFTPYL